MHPINLQWVPVWHIGNQNWMAKLVPATSVRFLIIGLVTGAISTRNQPSTQQGLPDLFIVQGIQRVRVLAAGGSEHEEQVPDPADIGPTLNKWAFHCANPGIEAQRR